jgi:hypothetical protein
MRVVESPDGTVKVVELDPTKKYVLVIDDDALIGEHMPELFDGEIILKRSGTHIEFVENPEQASVAR